MVGTWNLGTEIHHAFSCPYLPPIYARVHTVPSHGWWVFASGPTWIFPGYCVVMAPALFIGSVQEIPYGDEGKVLPGSW